MNNSDTGNILSEFYIRLALFRVAQGDRNKMNKGNEFETLFNYSLKNGDADNIQMKDSGTFEEKRSATSIISNTPSLDDRTKFELSLKAVLFHEGEGVVREANGKELSKFGITETTARSFGYTGKIKDLTRKEAMEMYRTIWARSGAQSLPYPLSVVYFDTYVNSPSMAKKLLAKSNGDVNLFLNLRLGRYKRLAQLKPDRYGKYLKGWINRVTNLRSIASSHSTLYANKVFKSLSGS